MQRRVALKVVKPGRDTRHLLARFEQERQALALMDHPNIAKVHDAGVLAEPRTSVSGPPAPLTDVRGSDNRQLIKGVPFTKLEAQFEEQRPKDRVHAVGADLAKTKQPVKRHGVAHDRGNGVEADGMVPEVAAFFNHLFDQGAT